MGHNIREVMTSNPSTIEPDRNVVEAARIVQKETQGMSL
jgi:CBS domain-containing protein